MHFTTFASRRLPGARDPVAIWLAVALIGIVLGAAALAGALGSASRDYVARDATVLNARAL